MKNLNKKSQSAIEYLQNYSWAILIIIILGVALWQLGVFSAGPKVNVAYGFKKIKVLEPSIRYAVDPNVYSVTNTFNFTVINTEGAYIHDLSVSFGGDCGPHREIMGEVPCDGSSFSKDTLAPSEIASVGKSCCNILAVGDFFYINVNITYAIRVGEEKITKTDSGVIQGYVERKI